MIPFMKPSISILCLAIAMHCWAEDNSLSTPAVSAPENPVLELVISSDNAEAGKHLNLGLQCCLLNYQEKARYHFRKAIESDSECLMAHVGMLMVYPSGSSEYKQHLMHVNELAEICVLTPVEEWYFSTFLQYISGDLNGAAAAFRNRAATYRRDTMAACWDIILNHYAAEQGGNIHSRADSLVERCPDNALAHYCRALLDEYTPKPSQKALECARKAAELLPANPAAKQLLGHLLSRSGALEEAVSHFQEAQRLSMDDLACVPIVDAATYRTASLSEISAYWSAGHKIEALRRSHALSKQITPENRAGEGNIIMHWEARTLPLRLLVLQTNAPAGAAINMAAQICNAPEDSPLKHIQDCLVAAIRTRSLAEAGRTTTATQTLTQAEKNHAELVKYRDEAIRQGGLTLTCYNRALRACMGAILRARLALFADSESIWKPHLDELLSKPEPRLLPPVLPQQPAP